MAESAIVPGRVESFYGDQIAVDVNYLKLVEGELTAVGATFKGEHDQDEDLGLALITLNDTKAPVQRLREDPETQQALLELELESLRERGRPPPDLDLLLRGLRDRFARRYANFDVTMGKNRVVEQVKGFPHLGGGGDGDPTPADAEQFVASPAVSLQAGGDATIAVLDTAIIPQAIPMLHRPLDITDDARIPDELPSASAEQDRKELKVTQGHGTFVVGLIAQRAPSANLVVRRVLDEDAVGDAWDAAKKLVQLAKENVNIINLSFGSFTDDGQRPLVLSRAVDRISSDVVIVAAAGNHGNIEQIQQLPGLKDLGPRTPIWPAALDDVVAAGAVDDKGALADCSARTPWVNVKALGVDVVSAFLNGKVITQRVRNGEVVEESLGDFRGVARWRGTSFAAAIVSGVIAARTGPDGGPREVLATLLAGPADEDPDRISRFTLADLGE
jgi:membrane-anchored mycosin MYCP